jgi:hypothetical protein
VELEVEHGGSPAQFVFTVSAWSGEVQPDSECWLVRNGQNGFGLVILNEVEREFSLNVNSFDVGHIPISLLGLFGRLVSTVLTKPLNSPSFLFLREWAAFLLRAEANPVLSIVVFQLLGRVLAHEVPDKHQKGFGKLPTVSGVIAIRSVVNHGNPVAYFVKYHGFCAGPARQFDPYVTPLPTSRCSPPPPTIPDADCECAEVFLEPLAFQHLLAVGFDFRDRLKSPPARKSGLSLVQLAPLRIPVFCHPNLLIP